MRVPRSLTLLAAVALALPAHSVPTRPPVRRVFVYVMENMSYDAVVGSTNAPYLNSLVKKYALATNYSATGHASLDNYIAMTSGQPPNPATAEDCPVYGSPLCLQDVDNIGDQMEAAHRSWRAYLDAMPTPCAHPTENGFGSNQRTYAPKHNPFVYYRSIVDDPARCAKHVVPLAELWRDQQRKAVPDYVFIAPDLCHDGHDSGSACTEGGGLKEADSYARRTIPRILADKSFRDGGLLFLTFDEGGTLDDDTPLAVDAGGADFGGHIYTLLVSPNVTPGAKLTDPYDHFSMLKTVEDVFCLPYLGLAGGPTVKSMIGAVHQARCAKLPR
jgi:hypothetical protein